MKFFLKFVLTYCLVIVVTAFGTGMVNASNKVAPDPASVTMDEDGDTEIISLTLDEPIIVPEEGDPWVTINISSDDVRVEVSPASVVFLNTEWTETKEFTITTVGDSIMNPDNEVTVTLSVVSDSEYYDGYENTVLITLVDDDEDVTPPETFITFSDADSSIATFEFSSDDVLATFECSLDEDVFVPCTSPYATPVLLSGEHSLEVRATDAFLNVDSSPATETWTVEEEGPSLTNGIELVDVSSDEVKGNANSSSSSISSDGRYIAFASDATNLIVDDTNAMSDVFVYDRDTDTIERVSVNNEGAEGDSGSYGPSISSDGRYIAFYSDATNLVGEDTNATTDVFVYDRDTDTIERVSVNDEGAEGDSVSNGPSISSDGRYVAFTSDATNLVADDTNATTDVFVYDRDTDTIERVSVNNEGEEGECAGRCRTSLPYISSDGKYVVFSSTSDNLVADDTNGIIDVFVYDRDTDTIERVSVNNEGEEGDEGSYKPSISSDGRYIAFYSDATNLVANDTNAMSDVFVYDNTLDTLTRLTSDDEGNQANAGSYTASISSDGVYVAFSSDAYNLIDGDENDGITNIFRIATVVEEEAGPEEEPVRRRSSGTTRSARINNLRAQGKETEAQKIEQEVTKTVIPTIIPPLTRLLKYKMIGEEVRIMQQLLNKKGYTLALTGPGSPGNETQYYGPKTLAMIKKFQLANGLIPDGIVGPLTWGMLNK